MDAHVDSGGERHGSLVRVIELQQIESSFNTDAERKEQLEFMVERAHAASNHCPMHYDENAAWYVDEFDSAEKEAEQRLKDEEDMKEKAFAERREEKQGKKLARVRAIYDLLDEYLGECPDKEMALECSWRENDYQECLKFKCTVVEDAMRHLVSAPVSRCWIGCVFMTFLNPCV